MWDSLRDKEIEQVLTDFRKPYEYFVPNDKHIQSKAETHTVKGYNSLFRHFLARLRRKTKCYSKSKNASVFRHAFNGQMERWTFSYTKLTMPKNE